MPYNAIIYESNCREMETAVKDLMMVLQWGRHFKTSEFPAELRDTYNIYVIGGPVTDEKMDGRITGFVDTNCGWLSSKRVFLFGLVPSKTKDNSHFASLKELLGEAVLGCENIIAAPGELDLSGLAETGLHLNERARIENLVALPPEELLAHIEKFLNRQNYCTLCTAYGDCVRGDTPTYKYHDGYIYILREGWWPQQFANMILNDNVGIALYDSQGSDAYPARMKLLGKAEILEPGSDTYKQTLEIMGKDYEEMTSQPYIMWGIAVKLGKAEFWWGSEWDRLGVTRLQTYYWSK